MLNTKSRPERRARARAGRTRAACLLGTLILGGLTHAVLAADRPIDGRTARGKVTLPDPSLRRSEAPSDGVVQALSFLVHPSAGPADLIPLDAIPPTPQGATAAGCSGPTVVTHTDGSFEGGQFIVQLGFAEDEIFAAQYQIPPDQFPITIRQINFILAQQGTVVTTTTHYTVFIWDGEPGGNGTTSIEVARFNSVEDLAPVIMPGDGVPHGTNVRLVVDQGDPNQIVISNTNGTNAFSIGIRIDAHNAPPPDPCNPPLDSFVRNAYPAVDNTGLSSPTGNWIFALACPGSLCPSGWNQFANLGICQPSGDWFIKATYECPFALTFGACCNPAGACLDNVDNVTCGQLGPDATFFEGQLCADVTCPGPTGACCAFGTCLSGQTLLQCDVNGGTYLGDGTDCANSPCVPGACCMPDGSCNELIESLCTAGGGSFQGAGTQCAGVSCPQPGGACCFGEVCVDNQQQSTCEVTGVWLGPDTTCAGAPCSTGCPTATILSSDPPDATVDARQPHAPFAELPRMGIGSIDEPILIDLGVAGAESCFQLCETAVDPLQVANGIDTVVDLGTGLYEITLFRAITAGAATTIQYTGDASYMTFFSHPGNANADAVAGPSDILAVIDGLNGVATPPHGLYSSDIDHSGVAGPEDILRVIDLLNGAGMLDAWLDSPIPTNTTCP